MTDNDLCYICFGEGDDTTFLKCDTCQSTKVHYACFAENIFRCSMTKPITGYTQPGEVSRTNLFDCGVHKGAISNRLKLKLAIDYKGTGANDVCVREADNTVTPLTVADVLQTSIMALRMALCLWTIVWFSTWSGTVSMNLYLVGHIILLLALDYLGLKLVRLAFGRLDRSLVHTLRKSLFSYNSGEYLWFIVSAHVSMGFVSILSILAVFGTTKLFTLSIPLVNRGLACLCMIRAAYLALRCDIVGIYNPRYFRATPRLMLRVLYHSYILWGGTYLRAMAAQEGVDLAIAVGLVHWFVCIESHMMSLLQMSVLFVVYIKSYWKYHRVSVIFEDEEMHKRTVVHFSHSENLVSPLSWITAIGLCREF